MLSGWRVMRRPRWLSHWCSPVVVIDGFMTEGPARICALALARDFPRNDLWVERYE